MVLFAFLVGFLFAPLSVCQEDLFSGFEGHTEISEAGRIFRGGGYIIPNESEFYSFGPALKDKTDTIISVGSFRALESASRGKFDRLIMADVDPGMVAFNQEQIQALRESTSPLEWIGKLMRDESFLEKSKGISAKKTVEALANALNEIDNQPITNILKRAKTDAVPKLEEIKAILIGPIFGKKEAKEIAKLLGIPRIPKEIIEALEISVPHSRFYYLERTALFSPEASASIEAAKTRIRYAISMLEFMQYPGERASFLSDPQRFARLKALAQEGRIHSLRIDLNGDSFGKLGELLRQNGIVVSMLDVSNAPDYFLKDHDSGTRLLRNLQSIPFTEDARFHLTSELYGSDSPFKVGGSSHWKYLSIPINEFKDRLRDSISAPGFTSLNWLLETPRASAGAVNSGSCKDSFAQLSVSAP